MANKRIDQLPAAPNAQSTDLFVVDQDKGGGALETRKLQAAQVRQWLQTAFDGRYAQLAQAVHLLDALTVDGAVELKDALTVDGAVELKDAVALLQMLTVGGDPLIKAKDAAKLSGGMDADFDTMPKVGGAAIVSSGSNANGNWVQYADGTMLQYGFSTETTNAFATWGHTYPKTFSDNPSTHGYAHAKVTDDYTYYDVTANSAGRPGKSELLLRVRYFDEASLTYKGPASTSLSISWFSIGRWK